MKYYEVLSFTTFFIVKAKKNWTELIYQRVWTVLLVKKKKKKRQLVKHLKFLIKIMLDLPWGSVDFFVSLPVFGTGLTTSGQREPTWDTVIAWVPDLQKQRKQLLSCIDRVSI